MDERKVLKELRQIRNALIVLALKSGATSEEIGCATGIGGSNVRAMFPGGKRKGKKGKQPKIEFGANG